MWPSACMACLQHVRERISASLLVRSGHEWWKETYISDSIGILLQLHQLLWIDDGHIRVSLCPRRLFMTK